MSSEWTEEGNEEEEKKSQIKHNKKKKETKRDCRDQGGGGEMRWEKHFAGSLSVNHNLLGVGCERKSAILQWLSLSSQL